VLKKLLHTLLYLIATLFLQINAFAQSAIENFSYSEKTQMIQLAKAGDANALYKLGLSHLQGLNAVQNRDVAERFFFHAAEKGHVEAKQYLITLPKRDDTPKTATARIEIPVQPKVEKRPSKRLDKAKSVVEAVTQSKNANPPSKAQPDAMKAKANKVTPETAPITREASVLNKTPKAPSFIQATPVPKSKSVKLADQTKPTQASVTKNTTPKSKWRFLLYGLYGLGLLLVFLLIYSLFAGYRAINKELPDGFSRRTYLKLNPDVRSSGMNAAAHYLKHGQHEGRPYK